MAPSYPPQRGVQNFNGRQFQQQGQTKANQASVGSVLARSHFSGQPTTVAPTDPSLYQWDRLSTEQQQAVLRTIRLSQRGGMSRVMRVVVGLLVFLGLLAAFAVLALLVFHLGGITTLGL